MILAARPRPPELPPPGEGRFDLLLLPQGPLVITRYLGKVRLALVLDGMREALRREPACAGWGAVADLRRFTGHLGVEGINALAALRREANPHRPPSQEVLLSLDPGMGFIAGTLNMLLPEICHGVGTDPLAACRQVLPEGAEVPAAALAFLGAG